MKIIYPFILCLFMIAHFTLMAQTPSKERLYVGTYSERGSEGIYVFEFDRENGELTEIQTLEDKKSPTFLAIHPNGTFLYAVYREGMTEEDKSGTITAFKIDTSNGELSKLNEQSTHGADPCHVSIDPEGKLAYVSNYSSGNIAVYPLNPDGSIGMATDVIQHEGSGGNPNRQQGPHMHSIIPFKQGEFLYASDLGIDKIMIYQPNREEGKLITAKTAFAATAAGAGPRHLSIHPSGTLAFSIQEISSTITAYKIDQKTGALTAVDRVPTLPEGTEVQNTTADIHVSPDGKFVYGSNRGHESIVIYAIDSNSGKLSYVGHHNAGGKHPRNFCMDSQGQYVFVANRDSDNVVVFKRDPKSGKLSSSGNVAYVPAAVCIQQLKLP